MTNNFCLDFICGLIFNFDVEITIDCLYFFLLIRLFQNLMCAKQLYLGYYFFFHQFRFLLNICLCRKAMRTI